MSEPNRRKRRKTVRSLPFVLILILICCFGAALILMFLPGQVENKFGAPSKDLSFFQRFQYSYRLYSSGEKLLVPQNPKGERILFLVNPSESVNSISARLEKEGLISSSDVFIDYLVYRGQDRCIRSGEYYLSATMTGIEIASKLCTSLGDRTKFSVLPGWRAEEIATSLASYDFSFSGTEFLAEVEHPSDIPDLSSPYNQYPSLEGFLFPASYPLDRDITVQAFVRNMIQQFDSSITNKMEKGFKKNNLNLYQAVVLASIIEREAVIDEEKPIIASVFYNRINNGMRLETDPTVQYALGYDSQKKSWWKVPLSLTDLQVNSPYNTYLVDGLPPGPICNPGIESMNAVAFPADTHYYYFRSACDGSGRHNFSETLDEHIQNACP